MTDRIRSTRRRLDSGHVALAAIFTAAGLTSVVGVLGVVAAWVGVTR